MLQTINNKIRRGFSRSAKTYDRHAGLHRQIADELFAQVAQEHTPTALLDVGCGTGYLTGKFKEHFPKARITGLDFSQGMLEVAASRQEDISWVLADGNALPFSDCSFDILVSNLAYQWAGDLSRVFNEARRVLAPNGILACTLFGFHTCHELFQSLDEVAPGLQFARLPDETQVCRALTASGFKNPHIASEQSKIEFSGMFELIKWLKSIGANNLSHAGFLGPEVLSRAAAIYQEKFSSMRGIVATFEVIRVYGKR